MGLRSSILLSLVCCLALSVSLERHANAAERLVRIGTEGAYPPFNFVSASGKVEGFEVDLSNLLCERMQARCEFVVQDWDGIIPALVVGKYDAIVAAMSITAERRKAIDFTDPYYRASSIFIAPKSGEIDGTPESLKGKAVGVQRASTDANYLAKAFGDTVQVSAYDTIEQLYLDLKVGRLDAILVGRIAGQAWLAKPDGEGYAQTGSPVYDPEVYGPGVGIGLRKGDEDLREAFNKAIAEVLADGSYDTLSQKYFPFSIRPDGN
jgi:polar amino acid transport system substrate-binding protein